MSAAPVEAPPGVEHTTEHTEAAGDHGAGGLPQFDPAWWPGQIVWLIAIFFVMYLLMAKVFVPRVGGTINRREGQIADDIAAARKLKDQAEAQAAEAAAETAQARSRAQKLAADAKARANAEAQARQAAEEAKLAEQVGAAEAGIRDAREKAMTNVRGIATDTAQAIVAKLSGKAATAAEVDQALAGRA